MRSAERVSRRLRDVALARTDDLMRVAHAGALLAVLALCGCATELTEIIVIVDSELAVPGELDEIVVTTEGASGLPKGASANLAGAGAASMPVTVGLRPGGAYDGPVTIRVRGRHAGDERVSAQVHTRFIAGARLVLRIDLASECLRILCGDEETCRNGFCVPYEVDPTELPRFTGTLPGRIGDAGRDLGPRDGGLDATHRDGSIVCTSNAECDDRETCNGLERCDAGACLPGMPMNCEDAFDCTSDSCTEAGGCRHLGDDSRCVGGAGGRCDLTNGCQFDSCTRATCVSDGCTTALCVGSTCNRISGCSAAQMCCGGACVAAGCDDGNPCTIDSCGSSGCSNAVNVGAPCSDGSTCTVGDACNASGSCTPGPAASCDDGNPCTDDACGSSGCITFVNSAACNDGSACTLADTCVGGACVGGAALSCSDGNPCTTDGCNPSVGCVFPAFDGPCNDGDACTTGEVCSAGACGAGTAVICVPSGVECRRNECRPVAGCVDVIVTGGVCDDGEDCTTRDRCNAGGYCQGTRMGLCVPKR